MRKLNALLGASTLALVCAGVSTVFAAPQGFQADSAYGAHPSGFSQPSMSISQVKQSAFDDQHVTVVGRLTNYFGEEHYEFTDNTGTIIVDLDDDRNWGHIQKDQRIQIFAEVDRDRRGVTLDVKHAQPVQ